MSSINYGQLTREQLKAYSMGAAKFQQFMGATKFQQFMATHDEITMFYPPRRTKKGIITREGAAIVRKVCVMYSGAVEAEFYTDEDADAYILSTMQLEEP